MSGKELLRDYFQGMLTTNNLSYNEFLNIVKSCDSNIEDTSIREWYSLLLQEDEKNLSDIKGKLDVIVNVLNEIDIEILQKKYKENIFSLESFINNLYNTGMILNNKILNLNSEIEQLTSKLTDFQNDLKSLENANEEARRIDEIIKSLGQLDRMIEKI